MGFYCVNIMTIILISRKDCVNDNEWNHYRNQIDVESRD